MLIALRTHSEKGSQIMDGEQLTLRQWRDADLELFVEMNADPEVMRFFPSPMTQVESAASLERMRRSIDERGWGNWVVEVDGRFAGFTGLSIPNFSAPFMPCTKIGWRFRCEFWGRGLAATQALTFGFGTLAFTALGWHSLGAFRVFAAASRPTSVAPLLRALVASAGCARRAGRRRG
jgi:RimJ/RimL family protein N-acetyltransferase